VKQFSREVSRQETAVSSANCEFSDVIAVRCSFGNAWFCYDVNKEFTKMHEFAMMLTQNLLNFEKYSW